MKILEQNEKDITIEITVNNPNHKYMAYTTPIPTLNENIILSTLQDPEGNISLHASLTYNQSGTIYNAPPNAIPLFKAPPSSNSILIVGQLHVDIPDTEYLNLYSLKKKHSNLCFIPPEIIMPRSITNAIMELQI